MARISSKDADVIVDELDFSAVLSSVVATVDVPMADGTAFLDADKVWIPGAPGFTIDWQGFSSTASPNFDGDMFSNLTTLARQVGVYHEGFKTVGNLGFEGKTNAARQGRTSGITESVGLNVGWTGDSTLVRAQVNHYVAALTSTANSTGQNSGTVGALSAAQKMVVVLRVLASSGTGNQTLNVVIQSDDGSGFGSPTTRGTFAEKTTSAAEEKIEVSGAVTDTYWRVTMTVAGSGSPTFEVLVTMGRAELDG